MYTIDGLEVKLKVKSNDFASAEFILLIIIEITGVVLNLSVLLVICFRYRYLRDKSRYILLGNIIVCDFILLVFIIPTSIKFSACEPESCAASFVDPLCSSMAFLFEFGYICVILTQVLLAIDTVVKVRQPCSPYLKRQNYWILLGISWTISLSPASIALLSNMTGSNFIFKFDFKRCATYDSSQCSYQIFILVAVLAFLAPIIPGSYFYLAWLAHRLKSHLTSNQDKDMQTDQQISSVSSVSVQLNDDSTRDILSLKGQYSSITKNAMILADIKTLFSSSPLPSDNKCSFHLSQPPDLVLPKQKNQGMSHNSSALFLSDNNSAKAKSPTSPAPSCNSFSPSLQIHAYQSHLSMHKHISENAHHVHVKDNLGLNSKYLSHIPSQFVDRAIQTSLPYETSMEDSEEWDSSGSNVSEIRLEETLPYYLKSSLLSTNVLSEKLEKITNASYQTLLMPSKINTAENTFQVQYSTNSSQQTKMMLEPPLPVQCLAFQNRKEYNLGHAKSSAAPRRRPVKNLLNQAVSTFCQHGLILMVTVYGCSLPFAVVSRCSILDLPFSAGTLAVCFYYSSCIWYPVVYFFTSANFRKQLSMTTVGGHS